MKVEVYHFNERTLDPWLCRVEEIEMTEQEFEEKVESVCSYKDEMYYTKDDSTGYLVLEW